MQPLESRESITLHSISVIFIFFVYASTVYNLNACTPSDMLSFINRVLDMCIGRDELDHPITWEMVEEHV